MSVKSERLIEGMSALEASMMMVMMMIDTRKKRGVENDWLLKKQRHDGQYSRLIIYAKRGI